MAIDPNPAASRTDLAEGPAINDDLPAYRALCRPAIFSAVFGAASILSFTHPVFIVFGVLAILIGLLAQRRIRKFPDILTGDGLTRFGIGASIIFCLSSVTITGVQDFILRYEANKFIEFYVKTLKEGSIEDCLFLQVPPDSRKGKSPKTVVEELKAASQSPQMFEMQAGPIQYIKERLKSPGQSIRYKELLQAVPEGMEVAVVASIELSGPATEKFRDETDSMILRMNGKPQGRTYGWVVQELKTKEGSTMAVAGPPQAPPPDSHEGHDHAPGEKHETKK